LSANDKLEKYCAELSNLYDIRSLLQWDSSVMMPVKGSSYRANQMAFISAQIYQCLNNPYLLELIDRAKEEDLNPWQQANIHNIHRKYLHNKALDHNLVEESTKLYLTCEMNWREAVTQNNFKLFANSFKDVVKISQEISQRKSQLLELSPYDSLLDMYDFGRRSKEIDIIFKDLENFLPSFLQRVAKKQDTIESINLHCPIAKQKELAGICIEALGFSLENGRLDTSAHPFSISISPQDIRITTRYDENNFISSIAAVLHETGHALYEQNLPLEFSSQMVGKNCGMTIHESQSLFIERHIGVTKEFFIWLSKYMDNNVNPEQLYKIATKIGHSPIRVETDEVSYPLHIILRYKLEKLLLSGDLAVDDLPDIWNEESVRLLNYLPKNYREGCLQDIHWAWGAFGYFPTYTLGAIFASQLAACLSKEIHIHSLIEKGNFIPITSWLKEKIHRFGSKYNANELIINSTSSHLNVDIFKKYLNDKYLV
jgi:carboxypeptidase Taq